ncbi:MAG: dienelactone hydrolase family protein [Spirochaetes bacterium]|nr:dienelactone hydrolase family protein [Spirochaetota bacterium]
MRTRTFIAASLATALLVSVSAWGDAGRGRTVRDSITVGRLERSYELYLPSRNTGEERLPLVIVLHGANACGTVMSLYTGFNEYAERINFIALYPNALGPYWNDGRVDMHSPAFKMNVNDVAFISRLVSLVVLQYHVDPKRVYIAGFSNGGMMALRLGIELSGRLAAVASVGGTLPRHVAMMTPREPVPVLLIHGSDDPTVPWTGGKLISGGRRRGEVLSIIDTAAYFAVKNRCGVQPKMRVLDDRHHEDGTLVFHVAYPCGDPEREVLLLSIQGGGHTWPGAKFSAPETKVGKTCRDINATEIICEFFSRHVRK